MACRRTGGRAARIGGSVAVIALTFDVRSEAEAEEEEKGLLRGNECVYPDLCVCVGMGREGKGGREVDKRGSAAG